MVESAVVTELFFLRSFFARTSSFLKPINAGYDNYNEYGYSKKEISKRVACLFFAEELAAGLVDGEDNADQHEGDGDKSEPSPRFVDSCGEKEKNKRGKNDGFKEKAIYHGGIQRVMVKVSAFNIAGCRQIIYAQGWALTFSHNVPRNKGKTNPY